MLIQKTRFLNKEKVVMKLSNFAVKAKSRDKNIRKIILFGSIADNTYTSLSDADILIILGEDKSRFIDRIPRFLFYFIDAPMSVDVFPYTEKECETVPLARSAISNGITLA